MKIARKILIALLVVFVLIQFFRPEKNIATGAQPNSITAHYTVPQDVQLVLKRSCYDCHSNNTHYPWYNNIQPVAWLLSSDVNEGKEHLNFDEFNNYTPAKKADKLDDLVKEIKEDEMPMGIYTMIHRNAVLSDLEKNKLISWADSLKKKI